MKAKTFIRKVVTQLIKWWNTPEVREMLFALLVTSGAALAIVLFLRYLGEIFAQLIR